ncbi:DUF5916 domain-containing protein [Salinivirga cyanobacteriivorans]
MKNPILIYLTAILLSTGHFLQAQKQYLSQKTDIEPQIDGLLNDQAWEKAQWINEFTQRSPYEGNSPSQKTIFKILYDDDFIYVGIRAFDDEPQKIERQLSRRDNLQGDYAGITFDSYNDKRTGFQFRISAVGVKADAVISNDGSNTDRNWDPIWYGKTNIDDKGWTAEMKIPLTQLRFSSEEEQTWGLQLTRYIYRLEEEIQWQLIPKEATGWVSEFGQLKGIKNIEPKKEASLTPYAVTSLDQFQKEPDNPFKDKGYKLKLNGGVNGKFGITNNLTLDMAINPDFGQVEADPSQVNLTAYETFYSEKRPFFIEGSNIMNFRLMPMGNFMTDNLFYSRRIGGRPHYSPDLADNEYSESPQNTSILGALKLTGKTKDGWSVGILESVTQKEFATIENGNEGRLENIEPLTNYFLSRVERDFNEGNTMLGGMFTATNRKIDATQLEYLHTGAYTGGVNFKHFWQDKKYVFEARSTFSHIVGSEEAITRTQESSTHYFQRPDANHLYLDSTRNSLTGYGSSMMFAKMGKGNIKYALFLNMKSPELNMNDMGYQREADHISELFWIQYRILEPVAMFRSFYFNVNQWEVHDFNGTRLTTGGNYGIGLQLKNYWHINFGTSFNLERLSKTALFGGPYLKIPHNVNNWVSISSDSRKKFRISFGGSSNSVGSEKTDYYNTWMNLRYKPHEMIDLSLNPSISFNNNNLQYVSQESFNNEHVYIMGHLDQTTLRMSFRANISLTPNLSIQYWGQPFISAGKYDAFKRITDPRANKYSDRFHVFRNNEINYNSNDEAYAIDHDADGTVDYNIDKPDFNIMDFISNLVIRWEYTPGSAVYLVWTQNRSGDDGKGTFNFSDNTSDLFNISPYNVFLIKATYRFSLN